MHLIRTMGTTGRFVALLAMAILPRVGGWLKAVAPTAEAVMPGRNGLIAFESDRDGDFEIYATTAMGELGPKGTWAKRLTRNNVGDYQPDWSPDGHRIAFTSDRDGSDEIYTMGADGTKQTRRTREAVFDFAPDWPPRRRT